MTEKELRDSLKSYLTPAGLPDSRREELLRTIRASSPPAHEKGEPIMFRPNKFRTALVLAAIVTVLSFTVALAAGLSGYVNYNGESVDAHGNPLPTPMPTILPTEDKSATQRDLDNLAQAILNISPADQLTHVSYTHNGASSGFTRTPAIHVDTLEELFALFPAELPTIKIPEGFAANGGSAYLLCDCDSSYELVSEETTDDGLTIRRWAIPEGEEKAEHLSFILRDAEENDISVSIYLGMGGSHYFGVDDAETVTTPDIPGMDDAILIVKPYAAELTMRRALETPVLLQGMHTLFGARGESTDTYPEMSIHVYSRTVPADVLLSMFAE